MNPAIKLGYLKENIPVNITTLKVNFGYYLDNQFKGIAYYNINNEAKEYLLNKIIPSKFKNDFDIYLMFINYDSILPHIDNDIEMVINFYIQSSDGITHFWNPHENHDKLKLNNQTSGSIFNPEQLNHIYSFSAKNYEIWALDVTKVHSVTGTNDTRIAFCFQSKTLKYEDFIKQI